MATHVLTGTPLSARGILLSLRQAFDAHVARMTEPETARELSATPPTRSAGFSFSLLGDVRHTV